MNNYLNSDTIYGQEMLRGNETYIQWSEGKDCYPLASIDATLSAYKSKYSGDGEVIKTYNQVLSTPYEYLGHMYQCRGANVSGQWLYRDTVRFYLLRSDNPGPTPPINKNLLWIAGAVLVVVVLVMIFRRKK
jgi:hypothetical protein